LGASIARHDLQPLPCLSREREHREENQLLLLQRVCIVPSAVSSAHASPPSVLSSCGSWWLLTTSERECCGSQWELLHHHPDPDPGIGSRIGSSDPSSKLEFDGGECDRNLAQGQTRRYLLRQARQQRYHTSTYLFAFLLLPVWVMMLMTIPVHRWSELRK